MSSYESDQIERDREASEGLAYEDYWDRRIRDEPDDDQEEEDDE